MINCPFFLRKKTLKRKSKKHIVTNNRPYQVQAQLVGLGSPIVEHFSFLLHKKAVWRKKIMRKDQKSLKIHN